MSKRLDDYIRYIKRNAKLYKMTHQEANKEMLTQEYAKECEVDPESEEVLEILRRLDNGTNR